MTVNVADAVSPQIAITGSRVRGGRRLRPAVWLSTLFLLVVLAWAVFPTLFTSESPFDTDIDAAVQAPSVAHWFGTDASGRDIFTRVVFGARSSLLIGVGATALALVTALVFGFAAGLGGRFTDGAISRFLEVLLALPGLLLALLFIAMFGPGVATEIVAVALGSAAGYAWMVRGQVLAVKDSGYVNAATSPWGTFATADHHPGTSFPNAMRPLVVLATMGVGQSIVWASSLSFLGLGVPPPAPGMGCHARCGPRLRLHRLVARTVPRPSHRRLHAGRDGAGTSSCSSASKDDLS